MAHIPLATKDRLLNKDFPVPISFIYGDDDWVVKEVDGNLAYDVCKINKDESCKVYTLPDSGHQLFLDNPISFCNIVKNDILGTNLPVGPDPTRNSTML